VILTVKSRSNRGLFIFVCIAVTLLALCHQGTAWALCTVSAAPADFGSYNVLLSAAHDTQSSITVDCNETPPARPTISIGPSPNSGGFAPRQMKLSGGSELINYNLYIDSGMTQIWGDGSGNTFTLNNAVFKKAPWIATVYGRIPPEQNVSAGTYNEILTVTIVW
jgi:spore coat protein U-like protein